MTHARREEGCEESAGVNLEPYFVKFKRKHDVSPLPNFLEYVPGQVKGLGAYLHSSHGRSTW